MEKIKHKPYGPYEKYIKRPLDLICSLIAIIVFSWLYLIIAILVRVKLGSPVIFTQDRPGKDEKIFKLYKFRTMTDEKDESGNLLPDSERLTQFGKILRATSLDELPEAFNIAKGDMSILGPRPLLPSYLPWYTERERHRHDQAFFDTEKTKTTEKGIQVGLFTMSGGKKEYELPLWTILPDLDHSKVELNISFPPTKMNVCIKDEDFLKRHPEFVHTELDIMAQELFQCAAECFMQKQEFEVLYIGQAYGKDGNRTAFDRLEQHATLQKILTEYRNDHPDKHIYILLLEIQKQLAMSFDGRSKEYMKTEEESDKHMKQVCCNLPEEDQVINITEAALINYFKPEYNINSVDNFPNENHKGYCSHPNTVLYLNN